MSQEVITSLQIQAEGLYLDCTLGDGGHTRLIAAQLTHGQVIGIDMDQAACARASLDTDPQRVKIIHANFRHLQYVCLPYQHQVNGALMDLGTSFHQLDDAQRGFSFKNAGPLDMRMNAESKLTALQVLKNLTQKQLAFLFRELGGERHHLKIARLLKEQLHQLHTTLDVATLIVKHVPQRGKLHPATRVFQALRVYVNDEINALKEGLSAAFNLLAPQGRLVVISFNYLEDLHVKSFMLSKIRSSPMSNSSGTLQPQARWIERIQKPTDAEIKRNPRARSAILRAIEKVF